MRSYTVRFERKDGVEALPPLCSTHQKLKIMRALGLETLRQQQGKKKRKRIHKMLIVNEKSGVIIFEVEADQVEDFILEQNSKKRERRRKARRRRRVRKYGLEL